MTKPVKWTDEKVKALKLPEGKDEQRVLVESGMYLFLRRRATGEVAKQWQFRAQVNGKRRWLSLGSYPGVSLAKARDELRAHQTIQEAAKKGEADHPVLEARFARKKAAAEPTVTEVFEEMLADKKLGSRRKGGEPVKARTIFLLTQPFEKDVKPRAGDIKFSKVTQEVIQACIDAPRKRGSPGAAAHVYRTWRTLTNFGAKRRYLTTIDPMLGIENPKPYRPAPVNAAADLEIKKLRKIMLESDMSLSTRLALELILVTGVRPEEAAGLPIAELDLTKRVWNLPAHRVKTNTAITIYLSDEALAIIEAAKALSIKGNPYLFPGRKERRAQSPGALAKAMRRIVDRLEEEGCRKFTPHDLRKTFRTMLARLGVAPHIAELCINHKEEETMRRVYDGHDYFPEMVTAWTKAGAHMTVLMQGGAEVIPLRRKPAA